VEAAVADVERLAVADPAPPRRRHREGGTHPLGHEPVDDQRRVRTRRHQRVQVAGVIDVVMADEEPTDVGGIDEAEHVSEELVSVRGLARVHHDGLLAADHHRVQRDAHRCLALALVVVDQEGLGCDQGRLDVGLATSGHEVNSLVGR
jgi:hypothetical protein